jgi:hypothetical protein
LHFIDKITSYVTAHLTIPGVKNPCNTLAVISQCSLSMVPQKASNPNCYLVKTSGKKTVGENCEENYEEICKVRKYFI